MSNPRNAGPDSTIARLLAPVEADPVTSTGATLELVGQYRARAGVNFEPHHHVGHELIVWRTGHIECHIGVGEGQQAITTYPGMITLMPGMTVHSDVGLTAYSHVYVIFRSNLTIPGMETSRVFADDQHGSLEQLLLSLEREFNSDHSHRETMLNLLHQQLALCLHRLGVQHGYSPAEPLVQQLERLIEERYADNPNLQDLAAELGTSTSNLRAKFAQLRPYSPKAYLSEVRVKHALGLIRSSSLSLETIASLTGYSSSGHLWRDVRNITGMTPGSFR